MATETTKQTTSDSLGSDVAAGLGSADSSSTQMIQNLRLLHEAKLSQLKRTAATLKKQYGAGNASVKAAEHLVRAGTARVAAINAVHQQVSTPAPQVAATGWALQGRVYHSAEKAEPAAHYTVYFTDTKNIFQRVYGLAYTDDTGLYLINYAGDAEETQAAAPQLVLQVANSKGKLIYIAPSPFQPVRGVATYLDIYLPAGETVLGDPPAAIRGAAMPPKASTKK